MVQEDYKAMAQPTVPRQAKMTKADSIMAVSSACPFLLESALTSRQTNNSSIVSKRSVERLYFHEPHFFRYFVKKAQRRSPLINRGYALRMQAVDDVVRRFLDEPVDVRKVVINLGCG